MRPPLGSKFLRRGRGLCLRTLSRGAHAQYPGTRVTGPSNPQPRVTSSRQRRQFQKVTRFTGYVLSYPARPNFGVTIKAKSGRIRRWHQVLYVTKHTFWQHHNLSLSQHVGEGGGERSLCLVQHA
jgi:hypothetical protein